MNSTQHPSNNVVYRPPPGTPHEECKSLAVTQTQYDNGQKILISYWLPTEAEKAAIMAGKPVCLHTWGWVLQPVYVGVDGVDA